MKIIKYILLILIIITTTSCYNYLEVNEIAIVEGIAIDYIDNKYQVILEIIDIKEENENSYLIESESINLEDAINNIKKLSSKRISMSHLEVLIISKNILNNHFNNLSTYFINNKDITTNFYLVYSDNPKEIINNKNDNFKINSKTIVDILDIEKNNKYRFDYIFTVLNNNKTFKIPYVSLDKNNIKIEKEDYIYEKWYCNKLYII